MFLLLLGRGSSGKPAPSPPRKQLLISATQSSKNSTETTTTAPAPAKSCFAYLYLHLYPLLPPALTLEVAGGHTVHNTIDAELVTLVVVAVALRAVGAVVKGINRSWNLSYLFLLLLGFLLHRTLQLPPARRRLRRWRRGAGRLFPFFSCLKWHCKHCKQERY